MNFKRLVSLIKQGAPKEQYYLELGSYFIRKGTGYEVGQPFQFSQISRKKDAPTISKKQLIIKNLYFNFKENKVTYTTTTNPDLNRVEQEG
jgi:hypothetical protein